MEYVSQKDQSFTTHGADIFDLTTVGHDFGGLDVSLIDLSVNTCQLTIVTPY